MGERWVSGVEGREERGPSEFWGFDEGQPGETGGDWSSLTEPSEMKEKRACIEFAT